MFIFLPPPHEYCYSDSDCSLLPSCPDGPIKDNVPCECYSKEYETRSVENWETDYGSGETLFCCNGKLRQLFPNQSCSS